MPLSARSRSIGRVSLQLLLLGMAGRILGIGQQMVVAHKFGLDPSLDAFIVAQSVPSFFLQIMLVGSLGAGFIPVFKRLEQEGKSESAWELISALLNVVLLAACGLATVVMLFSAPITHLFAPGFTGERYQLSVLMAQFLAPMIPFAAAAAILRSVGNMQRDYILPAAAAFVGSLVNLGTTWLLADALGANALVLATFTMTITVTALTYYAARRRGYRHRFVIRPAFSANAGILHSVPAIALIGVMNTVNFYASRWFASLLPSGQVSVLAYAWRFEPVIVGGIAGAVAAPLLTELAESIARKDIAATRAQMVASVRIVSLVVLPMCFVLFFFAKDVIATLFGHGQFGALETTQVSAVLAIVTGSLLVWSYGSTVNQYFFATSRWQIPAALTTVNVIVTIVISALVYRTHGVLGLAWSCTGSTIVFALVAWWLPTQELGNFWFDLRAFGAKLAAALAVMLLVLKALLQMSDSGEAPLLVALSFSAAGLAYIVMCSILHVEEARFILQKVEVSLGRRLAPKKQGL